MTDEQISWFFCFLKVFRVLVMLPAFSLVTTNVLYQLSQKQNRVPF
jgi:hypothetical protein